MRAFLNWSRSSGSISDGNLRQVENNRISSVSERVIDHNLIHRQLTATQPGIRNAFANSDKHGNHMVLREVDQFPPGVNESMPRLDNRRFARILWQNSIPVVDLIPVF